MRERERAHALNECVIDYKENLFELLDCLIALHMRRSRRRTKLCMNSESSK